MSLFATPPIDCLVSIIIVNYNAGDLLLESVRRVLDSTAEIELFLVDNASADGSFVQVQQTFADDARLHCRALKENIGFAGGINQVLPATRGTYILLLNPDCLIEKDTLSRLLSVLEQYPQAGMAGVLVQNQDGSEQPSCRRRIPTPARALVQMLMLHKLFPHWQTVVQTQQPLPTAPLLLEGISGAFMLVRREAVEQVGMMDDSYFLHCEDLDWFIRFQAAGWQILFVPEIRVTHIKGVCSQHQPLRVSWYKHRSMLKFYRKFFRQRYPAPLFWAVSLGVWSRFAWLAVLQGLGRWMGKH